MKTRARPGYNPGKVYPVVNPLWYARLLAGTSRLEDPEGRNPPIVRFRTQKAAALFAYLALHPGRTHSRELLAELLWPGSDPIAARNRLKQELAVLRRQIEAFAPGGVLLTAGRGAIGLQPGAVRTDVEEFESALTTAAHAESLGDRAEALTRLRQAVALYGPAEETSGGGLLPGLYDEWLTPYRERLSLLRQEAAGRIVALWEEGTPPGTPLSTPVSPPQPNTTAPTPSPVRLPLVLTRFVGRDTELDSLLGLLLRDPMARLVTLTGTGGVGKTRLAVEAVRALTQKVLARSIAIAAWVSLADLPVSAGEDRDVLADAVCDSLLVGHSDAPRPGGESATERAIALLRRAAAGREGRPLLVLDNAEHIAASAAVLAAELLAALPHLVILATSRQPLQLTGEREVPLTPLPVGKGSEEEDALILFADRARLARPDFALSERNVADIRSVCRLLDGLPLAIELAAARCATLSPAQIREQLEVSGRFGPLLVTRRRDVPDRHRSLAATLSWSVDQLTPADCRFFARLSVFRGSFTAEAAAAVAGEENPANGVGDTGLRLEALHGESLLVADPGSEDDSPRMRMLETVREFAASLLLPAEEEAVHRRYVRYFRALAESVAPDLLADDRMRHLDRLEADRVNLREAAFFAAAAATTREPTLRQEGLRLACAAEAYWRQRGHIDEARTAFAALLSGASLENVSPALLTQALAEAGELGLLQDDAASARAYYTNALKIHRAEADRVGEARALNGLARVEMALGRHEAAEALYEQSLTLRRAVGAPGPIAFSLNNLGVVAHRRGDLERARARTEETLALQRALHNGVGVAVALTNLAAVDLQEGREADADRALAEALELLEPYGATLSRAEAQLRLGQLHLRRNAHTDAQLLLRTALAVLYRMGKWMLVAEALETLAATASHADDHTRAARLWGAAKNLRIHARLPEHAACPFDALPPITASRNALGAAAFDALARTSATDTLDTVITTEIATAETGFQKDS